MGRRRISGPTRDEKEKVRKPRTRLFLNAERLSKLGTDVFVAVRYHGEVHYFSSCSATGWPLGKGDLSNARSFRNQGKNLPLLMEDTVAADKEPQNLINTSENLATPSLAINLRSPPILQASPVDERHAIPGPFAAGNITSVTSYLGLNLISK